jgi:MFS family permease
MGPGGRRAALLLVAIVSVNASYTVLIPFVPDLQERMAAGPSVVALAFALFAAGKAAAQPVGGIWVDRWRPGGVAFVSLLVAAAGIALTAVARDPLSLLTGRICWGLGEGLVTPALYAGMAALCRQYGLSTSRMMGYFGSAAVSGFLLGPLVAGLATPLGLEALFLTGAVATVVTAFGVLVAIPAPTPPAPAPDTAPGTAAPGRWWTWVLVLGALDMVTNLSYSALEPVLPLHLDAGRDASARGAIAVVFVIGLATFGLCTWLLGRHAERLRLVTLVKVGLALSAVGLAGLATSTATLPVAAWFVLIMTGQAVLYLTARRGVVELRSAMTRQGKAFGLFGLASDVGNIIGPVVGVALYAWTGSGSFVLLGALSGLLLAGLTVAARRSRPVAGPVRLPEPAERGGAG